MLLSIVVPCYNEEAVIRETNRRLLELAERWLADGSISDFEIIYVDDGSRDQTLAMLREFAAADGHVRAISFSRNFGHQAAILAGMHHASGDFAVTLDADLQDPPETITAMLAKAAAGYDIVYGVRTARERDTFFKRTTAHAYYRLLNWMGVPVVRDHADFRMISRPVLDALDSFHETTLFLRGVFPLMGFRSCTVTYARPERFAGETKYPLRKMVLLAINGVTAFTYLPLRFAFVIGALVFLVSLVLAAWALVVKFTGGAVPGWASSVVPLYLFGGMQMMFIGMLGEYIGKIFHEIKRRPRYIVREGINLVRCRQDNAS